MITCGSNSETPPGYYVCDPSRCYEINGVPDFCPLRIGKCATKACSSISDPTEEQTPEYTNDSLCKECGGACCKNNTYIYSAQNLDLGGSGTESADGILDSMMNNTYNNNICIELVRWTQWQFIEKFDGNTAKFPSSQIIYVVIVKPVESSDNRCVHLDDEVGCLLKEKGFVQPEECRSFQPRLNGSCVITANDRNAIFLSWLPYQDQLRELYERQQKYPINSAA